jgi:hypothetical protein
MIEAPQSREERTARTQHRVRRALVAGLLVALALAGLAYWQRSIAVEQETIAPIAAICVSLILSCSYRACCRCG